MVMDLMCKAMVWSNKDVFEETFLALRDINKPASSVSTIWGLIDILVERTDTW
jgi:hypothetical protein